ncbi:hypothetical protein NKH77_36140 [Streptomyces sp. M19]
MEFDDDRTASWEVEVVGTDHREHELAVDARTGEVTSAPADDDHDDHDDDRHDDDRDDD